MKRIILTALILTTSFFSTLAQTKVLKEELKNKIDSLFNVDQQVQFDFIEVLQRGTTNDTIKLFENLKKQAYARHIPILKKVIKQFGYPTFELVGIESSTNFFTLIQHSDIDLEFQTKMLKLIKKQVDKKQAKANDFAFLTDRVLINSGKEQLYGTQLGYDAENNAFSKNLKDKKNVNKRRAEVGMESLEEYLKRANELHKKQNQKN